MSKSTVFFVVVVMFSCCYYYVEASNIELNIINVNTLHAEKYKSLNSIEV